MTLARFLRFISRHGGGLSSPASGADSFYRALFHYFEGFVAEYEGRFEREYGYFRPIVKEVVEKYLDCGNPRCGFARIRCPDCGAERFVMFSCRTRGFCPSCHAKRLEEWGEWMRETLLLDFPHRQIVFTIWRSGWSGRSRSPNISHKALSCRRGRSG